MKTGYKGMNDKLTFPKIYKKDRVNNPHLYAIAERKTKEVFYLDFFSEEIIKL